MTDLLKTTTATVQLTGIEIIALEKLSLVSHALAQKLGGSAGTEQKVLVSVLDDVILQLKGVPRG